MAHRVLTSAFLAVVSLGALHAHNAMATCTTPLTQVAISTALEGNYASGTNGTESWNEGHCSKTLYDYKKGPTDPIDPQKIVGSYSYSTSNGSGTVQYSYTGGPSFTYFVQFISTGSYRFCPTGGGTDLIITVAPKAGCPSS